MSDELQKMTELARSLAMALIDEVAYHGAENCAEASIAVMTTAVRVFGLQDFQQRTENLHARYKGEKK